MFVDADAENNDGSVDISKHRERDRVQNNAGYRHHRNQPHQFQRLQKSIYLFVNI